MSDNGAGPAEDQSLRAHIETTAAKRQSVVGELRELHDAEQAIVEALTRQAAEARARRDGYKRALDQLDGKAKPLGRPPKEAAKQQARVYRPGDKYLDQVLVALRDSPEPMNHRQLVEAEQVTASSETLQRALKVLREEGRIRVASQRGQKIFYALMPDA